MRSMTRLPAAAVCAVALLALACERGRAVGRGSVPAARDAAPAVDAASPADADLPRAVDVAISADGAAPDPPPPPDAAQVEVAAEVAAAPIVTGLRAGFSSTCALFASGRIKCWGDNASGQLGLGDRRARGDRPGTMGAALPYVDLGEGIRVQALALGAAHVCALLDDGRVKCWGDNTHGQLGAGAFQSVVGDDPGEMGEALPAIDFGGGRKALSIATGPHHSCAVLEGGAVKCWGKNGSGNLGLGQPGAPWPREPGPSYGTVDLGRGRVAVAVTAGGAFGGGLDFAFNSAFSCALLDDGQSKCWGGDGLYGALGDPVIVRQRGTDPRDMGDNMPPLPFGGRAVKALAMGAGHGCALNTDDQVRCWGNSHQDQAGWGGAPRSMDDPYVPVNLGSGRRAIGVTVSGVTNFIDEAHSCAVRDDGLATCWGANWHGQLGLPGCPNNSGGAVCRDGSASGPLPAIDLGVDRHVQAIAAGGRHTCALLSDGWVKCWGDNQWGQLGLGDTSGRGTTAADMGEKLPALALW
jgi:alpha-tubulin suppressor-like RCC1 family protein